jgi:transcriptional regulator with XRE-family HTH domain
MDDATHQIEQEPPETAQRGPFADLIAARIKDHGATYRSLEDASGITDGSWANWHRGALPNKSLIPAAAKALGVDEEALRTLISAERSRRRAGIPIDTTEQTRAWIAQQPPASATGEPAEATAPAAGTTEHQRAAGGSPAPVDAIINRAVLDLAATGADVPVMVGRLVARLYKAKPTSTAPGERG